MAEEKKKKNSVFGNIVLILAIAAFLFSGYKVVSILLEYKAGTDEYNRLRQYADIDREAMDGEEGATGGAGGSGSGSAGSGGGVSGSSAEQTTMVNPIDFASLREINPDVVGWLDIAGLDISYPIAHGTDNDFYLHHTMEGEYNFAGCIFVDYLNSADFLDENTVIYGHNMRNGSMFGTLKKFKDQDFYENNKFFWIYTPDRIYQYQIVAAEEISKDSSRYQITFSSRAEFLDYLNNMENNSVLDIENITFNSKDRLVTLSTCTGDSSTRFVLQARVYKTYQSVSE